MSDSQTGIQTALEPRVDAPRIEQQVASAPWKPKNVLSLDGGGIRGYYSLLFLRLLMEYILEAEQESTRPALSSFHPLVEPPYVSHSPTTGGNYLPYHYFDYICGTSTGGLIAIMLGRLRMSIHDCLTEYLGLGGSVFGSPRVFHSLNFPLITTRTKYRSGTLEDAIQEVVRKHDYPNSEHIFKSHPQVCQTFVCAFKQNSQQNNIADGLWIFRSYDQHYRRVGQHQSQIYPRNPGSASTNQIWQVARATSAAPFYFKPLKMYAGNGKPSRSYSFGQGRKTTLESTFKDGGLGTANNPSTEIYEEILKSNETTGVFVSVGTGRKNPERFREGLLNQIRAGFDALGDTEFAHTAMQQNSRGKFEYFRFNEVDALRDMNFDEWKGPRGKTTIDKMTNIFAQWAIKPEVQNQIRSCANKLVQQRRLRAATSEWESYALGSYFYCNLDGCQRERDVRWTRRDHFEEHLHLTHGRDREPGDIGSWETTVNGFRCVWEYPSPSMVNGHGR